MYGHGLKSSRRGFLHLMLPAGASIGLANYVRSRRLGISAVKRSRPRGGYVKTGLDVLAQEQFAPLAGKRIGIITNHSGLTRDRGRNVDAMHRSSTVKLVTIFTPEHGLTGLSDDANIPSAMDEPTGVPVRSLFQGYSSTHARDAARC